jgi:hypothetical protein
MALANDCPLIRYGTGDNRQPVAYPVDAAQTLYQGAVALLTTVTAGGLTKGNLHNGAAVTATDICVGMVGPPTGGTYVATGPGIVNAGAAGAVWDDVQTGAFFFQSGTSADQLSNGLAGQTVYYGGENASGPIACATSSSSTRPILGVLLPQDPGFAGGVTPGANYWPVRLNQGQDP